MDEMRWWDMINIHKIMNVTVTLTGISHSHFLPIYYQIKLMGGRFRIESSFFSPPHAAGNRLIKLS